MKPERRDEKSGCGGKPEAKSQKISAPFRGQVEIEAEFVSEAKNTEDAEFLSELWEWSWKSA